MTRSKRFLACALCAVVLSSGVSWAQNDTAPATPPSQPAAAKKAGAKPKVAVIELTSELTERPPDFSLAMITSPDTKSPALSQLIVTLNKAAKDPAVSGVLLELKSFSLKISQAQDIGNLISKVRAAHKQVVVFSDSYDTAGYVLGSYADTIIMPENGDMMMPGTQIGLMFFHGLLEKLSLQADFIQVGKYKGAEEPYTRNEASPEFKAQVDGLVGGLYDQVIATVAANRKQLDAKKITAAIDEGWIPGKRAKQLGLVDQLMSCQQTEDWFEASFPGGAELVDDYGSDKKKGIDFNNPFAIFSLLGESGAKPKTNQPAVAVIYADGTIMDDTPGSLNSDGDVTPAGIRKSVDKALEDDLVKTIVLRIDSPGGSATASDEIWQILKEADKKKPIIVSMGHLAASGGYYIACAGRTISADPGTITGSIGVVGGKVVLKGLLDKIGVNIQTISRGKHADMLSELTPFTDEERVFVRDLMTQTYELFTSRVKAGRGSKIKNIEDVAQGRLFTGPMAKEAGLVDEVRTLPETIQTAAAAAGIERNYQLMVYPEPKTISDIIRDSLGAEVKLPFEVSMALQAAPPAYRREALRVLDMLHIMKRNRVMLAMPVGMIEK